MLRSRCDAPTILLGLRSRAATPTIRGSSGRGASSLGAGKQLQMLSQSCVLQLQLQHPLYQRFRRIWVDRASPLSLVLRLQLLPTLLPPWVLPQLLPLLVRGRIGRTC